MHTCVLCVCLLAFATVSIGTAATTAGTPLEDAGASAAAEKSGGSAPDSKAPTFEARLETDAAAIAACSTERQVVMCSHIAGSQKRQLCCQHHAPVPDTPSHERIGADPAAIAQSEAVALARTSQRVDLHLTSRPAYNELGKECFVPVQLPAIPGNSTRPVQVTTQFAPRLTTASIRRVKLHALAQLPSSIRDQVQELQLVNTRSGFIHPASMAGPAELVLMQQRLLQGVQPQHAAQRALLSGGGVRPKYYTSPESGRKWAAPTDCPAEGYKGPYAIPEVNIDWGGLDAKPLQQRPCAETFDPNAPQQMCGHLSFVELDAVMAYKQAVAWWATGDRRHSKAAIDIVAAWTRNNSLWGVKTRNGPLEAAWGVAGMARALELLRSQAPERLIPDFLDWVNSRLMPQMDWFVDEGNLGSLHSNFHAAITDAMTAVAILSDDRGRWSKARALFDHTVQRYLRWGKDIWAVGHVLGECTETQRDIYHTQMGLAGLIQAAEMAFQQDEDWYSSNDHALAASMELHARIVRAAVERDERLLPQGFKFFEHMPQPPKGTFWKFDLERQIWAAHNVTTNARLFDRFDGYKYMVGSDYLPAGWELAYNHFANRLGLKMPETAALLRRMWPEWYELYFGLGTLTHGATAAELWVPGIKAGFKQCVS